MPPVPIVPQVPQAPLVPNGPPQVPVAQPIVQERVEQQPPAPPQPVADAGWSNNAPLSEQDVKEQSATAVPAGPVPNLVANAFGEVDLLKKPPLKDFSTYQFTTDYARVCSMSLHFYFNCSS